MATQLQQPDPELLVQDKEEHVNDGPAGKAKLEAAPAPTVSPEKPSALAGLKLHKKAAWIALAIVALVIGTAGWIYFSGYESTDNAQVDGHLHQVSARISGTIL